MTLSVNLTELYTKDIDLLGELLRTCVFVESFGCYSCFDVVEGFREQPSENIPLLIRTLMAGCEAKDIHNIKRMMWYRDEERALDVFWYWDGDGALVFRLPDEKIIYNIDCKKSDWQTDISWAEEVMKADSYYE
jgi:hypothetical protein